MSITASPPLPWNFRPVEIKVTPDYVKAYLRHNPAALTDLFNYAIEFMPSVLEALISEYQEDFDRFVIALEACVSDG